MDNNKYLTLFISSAKDHLSKMKQILQPTTINNIKDINLEQLHLHAHSLKGEAFIMNYRELGEYITVIEKKLKIYMENKLQLNDIQKEIILNAIEDCLQFIEQIKSGQIDNNKITAMTLQLKEIFLN